MLGVAGGLYGSAIWILFVLLGFALLLVIFGRKNSRMLIAAAFCVAMALGLWRVELFLRAESQETLPLYIETTAVIEGEVVNDPERRDTSLRAHISVATLNGKPAHGTVLAQFPRDSGLAYGDVVRVRGVLEAPQAFESEGGRLFDYPQYLRVRGISALMPYATFFGEGSVIPGGFSLLGSLFSLKHAFQSSLERTFPEPDGSLLEGLLLGLRRGLPDDIEDAFIRSGLIHVVVLSGYNISIISVAVLQALSFLPQTVGLSLGVAGMIFFVLMTGAGAATVRALIMALIAVLANYLGRPALALRALAVAVAAMLLWNPLSLLFDPGFILSVLATFGLITLSPAVEQRLGLIPEQWGLRSIAASTVAVQIFVLPALLYFTGVLSFLAVPANVLALPTVSFAMGFGFAAGMLGFVHYLLAFISALIADLLLRWMMFIAATTALVPFGSTVVSAFPAWIAMVVYVPLTMWSLRLYKKYARQERTAARFEFD